MFSKPAVRSVEEIKAGLLSRAFERGGQAEADKMALLIEWRPAASRSANEEARLAFAEKFDPDGFQAQNEPTGSRTLDALNWAAYLSGSDERLRLVFDQQAGHHNCGRLADTEGFNHNPEGDVSHIVLIPTSHHLPTMPAASKSFH